MLPDRIEIVPRVPGSAHATIFGQAFSLDAEAARLAAVRADGELLLLDLPR